MGGSIFISYRRGVDSGFAGRLYDRLEHSFGRQRVFMDVDSIAPGEDFVAVLEARVAACDVLLALIGRGWLNVTDAAGQLRLDNPADFVRIEIAAALAQGKRVIPVVIDDVLFPRAEDLPAEIKPLARRQAIRVRHDRFRDDSERLIRALERALADAEPKGQNLNPKYLLATIRLYALKYSPLNRIIAFLRVRALGLTIGVTATLLVVVIFLWSPARLLPTFRDCDVCPETVALPGGTFLMGSLEGEEGRYVDEGPQHEVMTIRPFAIGKYEVTFAEWDSCVAAGGCNGYRPDDEGWGRGRHPVINVSWDDARAYCEWLAKETGKSYRLPSEAEWEYAARAGTKTRYAFGDEITEKDANFGASVGRTTEVGAYPANAWGLYDMHGNVSEWVADHWHNNYGGAPADGSAWIDATTRSGASRVVRGGSWDFSARGVRSAYRYGNEPGVRDGGLGFRCARVQS